MQGDHFEAALPCILTFGNAPEKSRDLCALTSFSEALKRQDPPQRVIIRCAEGGDAPPSVPEHFPHFPCSRWNSDSAQHLINPERTGSIL